MPRRARSRVGCGVRGAGDRHADPIVLDCDPGLDDAIAIMVALGSAEVEVLAVTTVAGNAPLHHTTANSIRVLDHLERADSLSPPAPTGRSSASRTPRATCMARRASVGLICRLRRAPRSPRTQST